MARPKIAAAAVTLLSAWCVSIACFTSGQPDGGDAAFDGGCNSAFGCDEFTVVDPCGDASLAIRARALFIGSCTKDSEQGCHFIGAGGTTLSLDLDAANYAKVGIIDVPSSEVPDVLRVEPFHPESSYLYWKVSGDPRILDGSFIMPAITPTQGGTVVVCYEELIQAWIEAGAP